MWHFDAGCRYRHVITSVTIAVIHIQIAFYFVSPGFFSKAFDEPHREVRFTPWEKKTTLDVEQAMLARSSVAGRIDTKLAKQWRNSGRYQMQIFMVVNLSCPNFQCVVFCCHTGQCVVRICVKLESWYFVVNTITCKVHNLDWRNCGVIKLCISSFCHRTKQG